MLQFERLILAVLRLWGFEEGTARTAIRWKSSQGRER